METQLNKFKDSIKVTVLPNDELIKNAVSLRRSIEIDCTQHFFNGLLKKLDTPLRRNFELAIIFDKLVDLKSILEDFDLKPDNEKTLNRLVVNYIRFSLVTYTDDAFFEQTQESKSYLPYHIITLKAISKAYPKYENECLRQIEMCMSIVEGSLLIIHLHLKSASPHQSTIYRFSDRNSK